MNNNWRKKIRAKYGMVLRSRGRLPHPQSPAALALMAHEYSKEEHKDDNYWTWLAFRDTMFAELGPVGKVCSYCHRDDLDKDAPQTSENLATLDHVVPLALGGGLYDKGNLVVACLRCNQKKADKKPENFKVESES